jgi:ADP-heptose:LPS heptosyltransferase
MQGLGDCIYQRAVMRQFLARGYEIWLETPWPALYHDMRLVHPIRPPHRELRTQLKNIESEPFWAPLPAKFDDVKQINYFLHRDLARDRRYASVPDAMLGKAGCSTPGDWTMTVPTAWQVRARLVVGFPSKPLLVIKPLTFRAEWHAVAQRNPDRAAYAELFEAVREEFFVVSVADVDEDHEPLVAPPLKADLEFNRGQLDYRVLCGLFSIADLVFSAPGFPIAMAQAVRTPGIFIFGAFESSAMHRPTATFAPFLGIDPIVPCNCFKPCRCSKAIDVPAAKERIEQWLLTSIA